MSHLHTTPRTTAHRRKARVSTDVAAINAVVDQSLVAHLGFVQDGAPFVMPTNVWRVDDGLYVHFAINGRIAQALRQGDEVCATISILDGLVLARSAMHHSVNYRSVMVFGRTQEVVDDRQKHDLLLALVDKVQAGRAAQVRPPDDKELAATAVFRLPISEATVKSRQGPPQDHPDDLALPVWGGVIPVTQVLGVPEPDRHVPAGLDLD
ncbi:MAG: pyridoxamine 5'-phosphate oxidase family protein [Magnetospirillum gryphiswaldense]|nr:pyridoxamine 5'-phosphate oxidase family protein [Magnetospirillum gryphiswaldense]